MPDKAKEQKLSIDEANKISEFVSSGPIFAWGAINPEASKKLLKQLSTDGKNPDEKIEIDINAHAVSGKQLGRLGESLLHMAAMVGDKDNVELMLKIGANPNEIDENRYNALHLAAQTGQDKVVSKLIEAGTSVRHSTNQKDKPIDLAQDHPRTYLMIKDAEKFDKLKESLTEEKGENSFNKHDRLASRIGIKYQNAKADDKFKLQKLFNSVLDDKELREAFVKTLDKIESMQQNSDNYSLEKMEWQRNMQKSPNFAENIKMTAPVLPKRIKGYLESGLSDFSSRLSSEEAKTLVR